MEAADRGRGAHNGRPSASPPARAPQAGGADGRVDKAEFGQLVRQLLSMTAQEKKAEEAGTAGASA